MNNYLLFHASGDPAFVKQKAPELFASAVSSALRLPELSMPSRRSQKMLSSFQKWSDLIKENSTFGESLVNLVVEHAFSESMLKARSLATKYEKMWEGYHRLIIGNELSFLWHSALDQAENPSYFQHFMQLVTRRVMDEAVKTAFIFETAQTEESTNIHPLKAEEEQALRYVAGYIPMKLKLKYKNKKKQSACSEVH